MEKISVLFVASALAAALAACTVTAGDSDAGSLFTGGSTGAGGSAVGTGGSAGTDAAPGVGGSTADAAPAPTVDAATSDAQTATPEAAVEAAVPVIQFSSTCQTCITNNTTCQSAYSGCRMIGECSEALTAFTACFNPSGDVASCGALYFGSVDAGADQLNSLGECLDGICATPCAPPADAGVTD